MSRWNNACIDLRRCMLSAIWKQYTFFSMKSTFFRNECFNLFLYLSFAACLLQYVHCPMSVVLCPFSRVYCPTPFVVYLPQYDYHPMYIVLCQPRCVYSHVSIILYLSSCVYCHKSMVLCPLSYVFHRVSRNLHCLLSIHWWFGPLKRFNSGFVTIIHWQLTELHNQCIWAYFFHQFPISFSASPCYKLIIFISYKSNWKNGKVVDQLTRDEAHHLYLTEPPVETTYLNVGYMFYGL